MDRRSGEYFKLREQAERAAAKKAGSPQARRIHQELAQNYAVLAQQERDAVTAVAEQERPRFTIVAPPER